MLNGISQAVSTLGRHITSAASRVSSAGLSGFSVSPQAVRLNPIRAQSPFSPDTSNINARTTFNVSSPATSFTPSRPAHRRRQVDRLPGHPALYRPLRRH